MEKKKTVMIVEDDKDSRNGIKAVLEKAGYRVVESCSGKECLAKLRHEIPDLIIMDIIMPEKSGWETIKLIRQRKKWNRIKICVLSILDDRDRGIEMMEEYLIDIYMVKPCDNKCLLDEVKELLDS